VAETASVEDSVFIGPKAEVSGEAEIRENVRIDDFSMVLGNAKLWGYAELRLRSFVYGNAEVFERALISESHVYGYVRIHGHSKVLCSRVFGLTEMFGDRAFILNSTVNLSSRDPVLGSVCYITLEGVEGVPVGKQVRPRPAFSRLSGDPVA
jgi:hypothetical protein